MTYTATTIVNNCQLGSRFKCTPTHKATTERVDSKHTKVVYSGLTKSELDLTIRALKYVEYEKEGN